MHLDGVHTVWKLHFQFEQPSLPNSLILARYSTFPLLQVEGKSVLDRASDEAEWVIFAPLLAMMMRQQGSSRLDAEAASPTALLASGQW